MMGLYIVQDGEHAIYVVQDIALTLVLEKLYRNNTFFHSFEARNCVSYSSLQ